MSFNKNANARADETSEWGSYTGALTLYQLDPVTNKPSAKGIPLGLCTDINMDFNKETKDFEHTLFDKRVTAFSKTLSESEVLNVTMQNFSSTALGLLLNNSQRTVEAESEIINIDITADDLKNSFVIAPEQAIGTVSITNALEEVFEEGVNYELNNGSITILSTKNQESLGATTLISEGDLIITNSGYESIVFEGGLGEDKYFCIYGELYNGADRGAVRDMRRYKFHKVQAIVETFPIKGDSDDELSYDVSFKVLSSSYINNPLKSKKYSFEIVKSKQV